MSNLEINLCNMIPTESTIYYIIVKGITDEIKKTPKKVTNVSKDDSEFKPNKRPVGTRER